jgi:hypothetical protein
MPQFGGKNAKKKTSSSSTKRHFTVVIGSKEHGLYVSSSPSSAARKAVSKLCATDKKKKVDFSIREITQGSKKKTYGPYLGYIEKLAKPIELKGRVIMYKPVAKLSGKTGKMKGGNPNCYIYFSTTMGIIITNKIDKFSRLLLPQTTIFKMTINQFCNFDKNLLLLPKFTDFELGKSSLIKETKEQNRFLQKDCRDEEYELTPETMLYIIIQNTEIEILEAMKRLEFIEEPKSNGSNGRIYVLSN